jgi:hypothetical protein
MTADDEKKPVDSTLPAVEATATAASPDDKAKKRSSSLFQNAKQSFYR